MGGVIDSPDPAAMALTGLGHAGAGGRRATGLGHAGAGPRGRFTRLMGVVLQLGTAVALGPRKNVLFFLNGKHSSAL